MGYRFPREMRIRRQKDFARVRAARATKHAGPLRVEAAPNDLPYNRLGLKVSKRVGKATRRNRVKRLLREAFRLSRHELPTGYDIVVGTRPHEPDTLHRYRRWLSDAVAQLDALWRKRGRR